VARNLSRWVNVIMARTFAHATVAQLAAHAAVPVINALSDREHPCQAMADYLTILEHQGRVAGLPVAYVGDGNNVCHSFLLLGAALGAHVTIGCPPGYTPDVFIVDQARALAAASGGRVTVVEDPRGAVSGAAVVYTDVWTSMGSESEAQERRKVFPPYQVNADLLAHADQDAIVLHCLPAHRGEEITDEVLDGPQSVVLDEAENRLHVQKALILELLGK
jgi:ornithine carbamoyltransferase